MTDDSFCTADYFACGVSRPGHTGHRYVRLLARCSALCARPDVLVHRRDTPDADAGGPDSDGPPVAALSAGAGVLDWTTRGSRGDWPADTFPPAFGGSWPGRIAPRDVSGQRERSQQPRPTARPTADAAVAAAADATSVSGPDMVGYTIRRRYLCASVRPIRSTGRRW